MDWIMVAVISGSLVSSGHPTREACLGRAAIIHEQTKAATDCVKAPTSGLTFTDCVKAPTSGLTFTGGISNTVCTLNLNGISSCP